MFETQIVVFKLTFFEFETKLDKGSLYYKINIYKITLQDKTYFCSQQQCRLYTVGLITQKITSRNSSEFPEILIFFRNFSGISRNFSGISRNLSGVSPEFFPYVPRTSQPVTPLHTVSFIYCKRLLPQISTRIYLYGKRLDNQQTYY